MVADNGLGEAPSYEVAAVAAAMTRMLRAGDRRGNAAQDDGGRAARAGWVEENASLARSGKLAASEVAAVVNG